MALKSARCPALALFLIVAGCADIPRFEPDTCGNLVVEAGEDCDTFADPDRGEALSCGPADGSPSACRYLCGGDARCPEGWVCSADLTCRHPDGRFVLADDPALILRADQLELADLTGDGVQEVVRRVGGALEALSLAGEPRVVAQAAFEALRGPLHAAPLDPELGPGGLFLPAAAAAASDDAPLELHVLWGGSGHLGTALAPRRSVAAPGPVLAAVPAPVLDGEVLVYLSAVGGGVALAAPDPA